MINLKIFLFVFYRLKECIFVLFKLDQFTTFTVLQILSFLKTLTDKDHFDQLDLNIFFKRSFFIVWSNWLVRKKIFSKFYR